MALITNSTVAAAANSAWFQPTKTIFVVDCDLGEVTLMRRRDVSDAAEKIVAPQGSREAILIPGGSGVLIENPVVGFQYRIVSKTPTSTASAHE
jgi:hypothetical protein